MSDFGVGRRCDVLNSRFINNIYGLEFETEEEGEWDGSIDQGVELEFNSQFKEENSDPSEVEVQVGDYVQVEHILKDTFTSLRIRGKVGRYKYGKAITIDGSIVYLKDITHLKIEKLPTVSKVKLAEDKKCT